MKERMIQLNGLENEPDQDLLEELGYQGPRYSLWLENSRTAYEVLEGSEKQINRTHSSSDSLQGLVSNLESNSTIIARYSHDSYDKEIERKLADIFNQADKDHVPHDLIDGFWDFVEKAHRPEDEEFPKVLQHPVDVELDASGIESYDFVMDMVEDFSDGSKNVQEVDYTIMGLSTKNSLEGAEKHANISSLGFQINQAEEMRFFRVNSKPYWSMIGVGDDLKRQLGAELESRGFEVY